MTIFGFGEGQTKFQLAELEWQKSGWKATDKTFTSDATVNENYQFRADVPRFPVQAGYPTSDLAGATGFSVIINAVNTNSSSNLVDLFSDPIGSLLSSPIGNLIGVETNTQKAYKILEDWSQRGTPLELRTIYARDGYKESDNKNIAPFVISSLGIVRNQDTGDSIGYTCILERIFISEQSQLVEQGLIEIDKGALGISNSTPSEQKGGAEKFKALGEVDEAEVNGDGGAYTRYYRKAAQAAGVQ